METPKKRAAECVNSLTPKSNKKKFSAQQYKREYTEQWPVLKASKKGDVYVHCEVCSTDFSVAHGGRDDCRRHVASKRHQDYASLPIANKSIINFFGVKSTDSSSTSSIDKVTQAEATMVGLISELNLPLTAADKISQCVKTMFPDSNIAKNFQCGRSKATAFVKEIAHDRQLELIDRMKSAPFTISTDGSNDSGSKQYPLVVRTIDPATKEVRSDLLSIPVLKDASTGENIYKLIEEEIHKHDIPFRNCIALGCDNANVMVGKHKGVYAFMQSSHPSIFLSGCVCHLIHIGAEKAASQLPFNIDELLIDLYYYLDKSSNRQMSLQTQQLLHNVKEHKILKHVCTRWLSVNKCLPRIIESWEPLRAFVKSEKAKVKSNDRLDRMLKVFHSPTCQLYCLFLRSVLMVFDEINTVLQCEEPKIHTLKKILSKLLRDLFIRFLKPVAIHNKVMEDVQFEPTAHHKQDSDILIGDEARKFISNAKDNHLREEKITEFYSNVKKFFCTACKYLKEKLPVKDELVRRAEVADVNMQMSAPVSSVTYFMDRFPCLLPNNNREELLLEFANYQVADLSVCKSTRMDFWWKAVGEMKDETGNQMFKLLPNFMLGILTIPHSSAHCERIFSCVRKNKTDNRATLGDATLESLLVMKSQPGNCYEKVYSKSMLAKLKGCYSKSLAKY